MSNSAFNNFIESMNYIGTYQYAKINVIELRSPKFNRVLFKSIIVRKIGISCEVLKFLFFSSL